MRLLRRRRPQEDGLATVRAALRERGSHLSREQVERRVRRTFRELCAEVAPTVSVEIGAHEASFSRRMKERVPGIRAVAYEANPYVHEKYREKVTAAGVEYLNLAVAPESGEVELTIPLQNGKRRMGRDNRQASLLRNPRTVRAERMPVPSVRLDDHLRLAPEDVVVAWIDVEGANGPVLESAERALPHVPFLYIEVEAAERWSGEWLAGDVARFLGDVGLVPVLRDATRRRQYNVVFARKDLADEPWVREHVDRAFRPWDGS